MKPLPLLAFLGLAAAGLPSARAVTATAGSGGASSSATLALPPELPYATLRLFGGIPGESLFEIMTLTDSGRLLIRHNLTTSYYAVRSGDVLAYRWHEGVAEEIKAPLAPWVYQGLSAPVVLHYDPRHMNESGAVIGLSYWEGTFEDGGIYSGSPGFRYRIESLALLWPPGAGDNPVLLAPGVVNSSDRLSRWARSEFRTHAFIDSAGASYAHAIIDQDVANSFTHERVAWNDVLKWSNSAAAWTKLTDNVSTDPAKDQLQTISSSGNPLYLRQNGTGYLEYRVSGKTFPGLVSPIEGYRPQDVNDAGRFVGYDHTTGKIAWGSASEDLAYLDGAGAWEITNRHDILGRGLTQVTKLWRWLEDGEGGHAYRDFLIAAGLPPTDDLYPMKMNSLGLIAAYQIRRRDEAGNPLPAAQVGHSSVLLVPAQLAVDANRDGAITLSHENTDLLLSDLTTPTTPVRHWANDDDDTGDLGGAASTGSDTPGQTTVLAGSYAWPSGAPDYVTQSSAFDTGKVDGRSDLIDFFPVFLDIKQLLGVLPHTTAGITYKLKHADGALNFVYTDLTRTESFHYLKHNQEREAYGEPGNETYAHEAKTWRITATGAPLNVAFLTRINDEADKGVILVECRQPTDKPLRLVVEKAGVEIAEVALNIKISPVEDMYRWINLRGVCGQNETRPSNLNQPPAYPDSLTNGKMFVFVHGYNVNEDQSRGWNAEAFKRLWHSGSRAMFTAVSWHGDHSQIQAIGLAPDYWDNIPNAFLTAEELAPLVSALPGSSKVIAGHSMGNVVVSAAIKDHGMDVAKYLMVDAAVALEAYDTSVSTVGPYYVSAMRTPLWVDYERRLWSTDWWQLFPEGDNRRRLTWMNRFGNIANAVNIYSSGEDVLNNNDLTPGQLPYPVLPISAERVWVQQEMSKGGGSAAGTLAGVVADEIQGGWGLNSFWNNREWVPDDSDAGGYFRYWPKSATEAAAITEAELRAWPFFTRFNNGSLMNVDVGAGSSGSDAADEAAIADLLGGSIPALSFPAGRNPVPLFNSTSRNQDLMELQDSWPARRPNNRWLHSDIRDVAYFFNYGAWDFFTTDGNLR